MTGEANDTSRRPKRGRPGSSDAAALRIVLVYAVVATAWILFSDAAIRLMFPDPDLLTRASSMKGTLFVAVTSALLFLQIRGDLGRLQESGDRLRESESRFRRVVDVSPVPMGIYDADGRVTLVNAAFTHVLGYTPIDLPTVSDWWVAAYPDATYRQRIADEWSREIERTERTGDEFAPVEARIRCKDGTERFMLVTSALLGSASSERVVVLFDLTEREQSELSLLESKERLARLVKSVIVLIGKVVETRDPYTQGHEAGVARIGRLIAEEMGMSAFEADGIEVAALVHDVGKLGVPAEILTKPGRLTRIEFDLIKAHSRLGYDILKDMDFDWPVADIVLQHHERMDGSGYPDGILGEDILPAARVLMVADVVEAMAAHRPYRPAVGLDAAMAEITSHPEKFDASVVCACKALYESGRIPV